MRDNVYILHHRQVFVCRIYYNVPSFFSYVCDIPLLTLSFPKPETHPFRHSRSSRTRQFGRIGPISALARRTSFHWIYRQPSINKQTQSIITRNIALLSYLLSYLCGVGLRDVFDLLVGHFQLNFQATIRWGCGDFYYVV